MFQVRQRHPDPGRLRVLGDVGQCLLPGPQQRDLGFRPHRPRRAGGHDLDLDPVQLGPAPGDVGQRLAQPSRLQRLRTQRVHRSPRLGQALPGQPGRGGEVGAPLGRLAGRVLRRVLGRLQLGDDPGKPLRQRVVDLPGHPLPLVQDPGLPRLDQQLLVQARVLGQRRLQPPVRLPQLVQHPPALFALGLEAVQQPGDAAYGGHVAGDDAQVDGHADRRRPVHAGRLGGGRHHGGAGHAGQLPWPGQQHDRVAVAGVGVEPEPRIPEHQRERDGDHPGDEHRHHRRALPQARAQRQQGPRRGRQAQHQVDRLRPEVPDQRGGENGAEDDQLRVRPPGRRPLTPCI